MVRSAAIGGAQACVVCVVRVKAIALVEVFGDLYYRWGILRVSVPLTTIQVPFLAFLPCCIILVRLLARSFTFLPACLPSLVMVMLRPRLPMWGGTGRT